MTRQRKWLIGVLCVGVGCLVFDRFVLAAPGEAAASESVESAQEAGPVESAAIASEVETTDASPREVAALPSYASLTERLVALQEQQAAQTDQAIAALDPESQRDASDPFALPKAWEPPTTPSGVPVETSNREQSDRGFLRQHRLAATMNEPGNKRAVVDGKLLKIGDRLQGYQLIQIYPRSVLWESPDGERAVVMQTGNDQ